MNSACHQVYLIFSLLSPSEVEVFFNGNNLYIDQRSASDCGYCRMFTGSLAEEVKGLQEDIDSVRDMVEDPIICDKIKLFVYAPLEIQTLFKADAGKLSHRCLDSD